jgi:hypothetical protein
MPAYDARMFAARAFLPHVVRTIVFAALSIVDIPASTEPN